MAVPDPPPSGPLEDQLTGRLLVGRYRLNRRIASGGMAEVWEATDEVLARRVAVKLLHAHLGRDDSFVQRFRAEAVAAARLAHPSIVSVYDTFSEGGVEAIVMELVVGTTMRADLDQHGPMRLEAVLAIGTQVADALGAAHAAGLVHRDVKPANILLSADGRVLVADFGIAKAAEGGDLTNAGAMVGTAKYLAPEQVEGGAIDGRADLYSLGVVLYEALTGVPPFHEESDTATALARLHRYPTEPRQLRPEIPVAVEAVVMRAMSRAPADRYDTAAAMRSALLAAGADPNRAPAAASAAAAANPPMAAGPAAPARPAAATPGPSADSVPPSPDDDPSGFLETLEAPVPPRRRTWRIVALLLLLAVLAGYFAVQGGDPPATTTSGTAPQATITGARSFDPQGDQQEHDADIANTVDGNPDTTWRSEQYADRESMAGKDGVGIALTLEEATDLSQLDVRTTEGGWSAQVYATDGGDPKDLAAWGDPVTSVKGADAGLTRLDLGGVRADRVLLWFTTMPPSGAVTVSELTVRAS